MNDLVQTGGSLPSINAEVLISKAIEANMPVESMKELLAMRSQLKKEQAKEAFYQALAKFQSECPVIKKTKEVKNKNGSLRYKYAPLEDILAQIKHLLDKHGFSFTIETPKGDTLTAACTVHHIGGYSKCSSFDVPIDKDAFMNDAQKQASAQTFAKRYAFCNAFGIVTGDQDDDAQALGAGATALDIYKRVTYMMQVVWEYIDTIIAIKNGIAEGNLSKASEAWFELDNEVKKVLWVAPTKGGPFTTEERTIIHSPEFRQSHYGPDETFD